MGLRFRMVLACLACGVVPATLLWGAFRLTSARASHEATSAVQERRKNEGQARHRERLRAQRQITLRLCDDPALATAAMQKDAGDTRALLREVERGTGWAVALIDGSGTVIAPAWRPSAETRRSLLHAGDRTFLAETEGAPRLVTSCLLSEWPNARVVSAMPAIPGPGYVLAPPSAQASIAVLRDASDQAVLDLVLTPPLDASVPLLGALDRWAIAALLVALVMAVVGGLSLAAASARSLRAIESAATLVAAGHLEPTTLSTGAGARRADETSRAMAAFDDMTRELHRTQRRLLRTERIAAWRDIAQRIAHEIKNPLQPIRVSMETLRKTHAKKHQDFDEIFTESSSAILEEVQRLERIVTEFSRFARLPAPRPTDVRIAELIAHVAAMHEDPEIPIRVMPPGGLPTLRADKDQLTQVLVNLVQNARDAVRQAHPSGGGEIRIEARPGPGGVEISIRDNGIGIAVPDQNRVFEPYFTTKRDGTGLGLAIVSRILSDHGGTIDIESAPGAGTEIRIGLTEAGPLPDASASTSDATPSYVGRLG